MLFKHPKNKAKKIIFIFGFAIFALLVINLVVYFLWLENYSLLSNRSGDKKKVIENLTIQTDKTEYGQSEIIKIIFQNLNGTDFTEGDRNSAPTVEASRYMGENYGVGMIEKLDNGKWLAIEPVWRCDSECYLKCGAIRQIKSNEVRTFYWPQTMLICQGLDKEEKIQAVDAGHYRVSSAIFVPGSDQYKTIYSNEFIIY